MSALACWGLASMIFVWCFTFHTYYSKAPQTGVQSRKASIIEAWTNIVIGFSINYFANFWIIPLMTGHPLSHEANFWGGWIYTTVSILRQYLVRRWFNASRFAAWLEAKLDTIEAWVNLQWQRLVKLVHKT